MIKIDSTYLIYLLYNCNVSVQVALYDKLFIRK